MSQDSGGDSTPPVIVPTITGPLGANGWYTGNVAVTWSRSDPESGISSTTGCATTTIIVDTAGTTLTCQATSGGGTSSQSVTIRRDTAAPTVALASPMPTLYDTGAAVNAAFTCADVTSGASSCVGSVAAGGPIDTATPGYHTVSVTAVDAAGNTTTKAVEYAIGTGTCSPPAAEPVRLVADGRHHRQHHQLVWRAGHAGWLDVGRVRGCRRRTGLRVPGGERLPEHELRPRSGTTGSTRSPPGSSRLRTRSGRSSAKRISTGSPAWPTAASPGRSTASTPASPTSTPA